MTAQAAKPQAFLSEFAPRLRGNLNSLLTPVLPTLAIPTAGRVTKRGTAIKSYAEALDDDDFEDSDEPRRGRNTGLRTRAENPQEAQREALKEIVIWAGQSCCLRCVR